MRCRSGSSTSAQAGASRTSCCCSSIPPVLTLGRQSDPAHILASDQELAARGIAVERTERGGEVTYHGPGQLVAYPIIRLHERGLLLRPFVRALEAALIETCAASGVAAARRDGHPGCWCDPDGDAPRKIGALGLRVERGVSYHGIALNVTVDLADFELIDPCGMPGVESTSIARELGGPADAADHGVGRAGSRHVRQGVRIRDRGPARVRGLSAGGERPVRAAQGSDHWLVGRHDRRSRVPSRSVRPGRGAR